MNVLIISASKDEVAKKIGNLCTLALEDLGVSVVDIDILEEMENKRLFKSIKEAKGIIILSGMRMSNIPSKLQEFFEIFEGENKTLLKGKAILPMIFSEQYNTVDGYKILLNNIIELDLIEVGKVIGITGKVKKSYIENQIKNMFEAIKNSISTEPQITKKVEIQDELDKPKRKTVEAQPTKNVIVDKKEDDITELAELFKRQLSQKIGTEIKKDKKIEASIINNEVTVKQMTQSLIHYFQPQLAIDMKNIFQLNVAGDEEFSAYLSIKNKECDYIEGTNENADVIINVDSGIWKLILMGSISAQKAFMTGKVKVRGDFGLLAKFDKVFKKM